MEDTSYSSTSAPDYGVKLGKWLNLYIFVSIVAIFGIISLFVVRAQAPENTNAASCIGQCIALCVGEDATTCQAACNQLCAAESAKQLSKSELKQTDYATPISETAENYSLGAQGSRFMNYHLGAIGCSELLVEDELLAAFYADEVEISELNPPANEELTFVNNDNGDLATLPANPGKWCQYIFSNTGNADLILNLILYPHLDIAERDNNPWRLDPRLLTDAYIDEITYGNEEYGMYFGEINVSEEGRNCAAVFADQFQVLKYGVMYLTTEDQVTTCEGNWQVPTIRTIMAFRQHQAQLLTDDNLWTDFLN